MNIQSPKPSRDQIVEHMDGNICRCGTYNRVRAAIHAAAREMAGGKKAANALNIMHLAGSTVASADAVTEGAQA